MTRRKFLHTSCLAACAARTASAAALNPDSLAKFVDPLPTPPIAKPSGMRPVPGQRVKAPHYRVAMQQIERKLHRDLPATRLWCCGGSVAGSHVRNPGRGRAVDRLGERIAREAFPADRPHASWRRSERSRSPRHRTRAWRQSAAGKRRLSRGLVRPGKVAHLFLSQPAGRRHALVSRPHHGHQSPQHRTPVCSDCSLSATTWKTRSNLPKGAYEIPLVICDRLSAAGWRARLSRIRRSRTALGSRSFRQCDVSEWQGISVPRCRAA